MLNAVSEMCDLDILGILIVFCSLSDVICFHNRFFQGPNYTVYICNSTPHFVATELPLMLM